MKLTRWILALALVLILALALLSLCQGCMMMSYLQDGQMGPGR